VESTPCLSSAEVIENSIAFHDPESKWESFQDSLFLTQITPDGKQSSRIVFIDRVNDVFAYSFEKEEGIFEMY
jgi:hypothetical protein